MKSSATPRILHTMLRISDIQESIEFYSDVLGMKVLRMLDQPTEEYTLIFLGYDDEANSAVIELTYNYGVSSYTIGSGFGHIAIGVNNIEATISRIKKLGYEIILEPKKLANSNEFIAFVSDPDGYRIELIQHLDIH